MPREARLVGVGEDWSTRAQVLEEACRAAGLQLVGNKSSVMIVIGIESATAEVGVCAWGDDGLKASFSVRPGRKHVETLHPILQQVLQAAGLEWTDVDGVAVDIGPGLFTGLRVGIAAAKAVGFALGVPGWWVYEALKSSKSATSHSTLAVVPVVDLRRGTSLGSSLARMAWSTSDRRKLSARCSMLKVASTSWSAMEQCGSLIGSSLEPAVTPVAFASEAARRGVPSASVLARLGHGRFIEGDTTAVHQIQPLYLRDVDAQANFATRETPIPGDVVVADVIGARS